MAGDKNYFHIEKDHQVLLGMTIRPDNPAAYADTVKGSQKVGVVIDDCDIYGSTEDAIDFVRGAELCITNTRLHQLGKNGITIKGAFNGYDIINVEVVDHGSECDAEIGQYDDYQRFPFFKQATHGGIIDNFYARDGKPTVVRVWNADKPRIAPGLQVKLKVVPVYIWWPYFCFRRLSQILGFK